MIILGDTHLGVRKFDRETYENQIKYLKKIIDIAAKNDKIIWQLGDFFDSRQHSDNLFLQRMNELFEYLIKKNVKLYTLLGNHCIYFRESRESSLISLYEKTYSNNFIIYKERDEFIYNDKKILIVPWLVKGESIKQKDLKGYDAVFGHFEINGFEVVKGHIDEKSVLNESFFRKADVPCFSGHYHIRNIKEFVKYVGTPYQLNWSDFNQKNGYYILDKDLNLEFYENDDDIYPKHIKLLYDDSNLDKPLQIQGFKKDIFCDLDEFRKNLDKLKNNKLKFFVNKANDTKFEEYLYVMSQNNLNCPFVNNQMISALIETNYIEENTQNIKPSRELIIDFIKQDKPEVLDTFLELLAEAHTKE